MKSAPPHTRTILLLILSAVAAYLLSFGPIWGWYTSRNQPPPRFVEVVYAPVITLFDHTPLTLPLVAYLYLWEKLYVGH
ncbi:hypothetical protein BH09VER1_BH09VER1_50970 [soil metagenome]